MTEHEAETTHVELPLDERLYAALVDALGLDESDAQAAHDAALPFIAEAQAQALRDAAVEVGPDATKRHKGEFDWYWHDKPVRAWLQERADQISRPGVTDGD